MELTRVEGVMNKGLVKIGGYQFAPLDGSLTPTRGEGVTLRPQTSTVLRVLCEKRGEIVSRNDLIAEVWPTTSVTDDSVTQCIREIRSALGPEGHRLVRTFPKRGYMLEAAEGVIAKPKPKSRYPLFFGSTLGIVILVSLTFAGFMWQIPPDRYVQPKIAIQPFQDIYQTEKWSRIGAGLANELAATLARNDWLEVRQVYQNSEQFSHEDYILTGTISATSDSIRLTAKLSEGVEGHILWSEVWTGSANDIFDIQSDLLEKVEATISSEWTGVIAQDRMEKVSASPASLGAFDLYLRAIEQKHLFTHEALVRSQRYLEQALELDPDYARAWTALAVVHLLQMEGAPTLDDFSSHLQARITATEKAIELAPNDPETLIQATFIYSREGNHKAAETALRRAVEVGQNNPDILALAAWGGARRVPVGADAIGWARRAFDLNPTPPRWYNAALATAAYYAKDYGLADEFYSKAPPMTEVLYRHAAACAIQGKLKKATALLTRAKNKLPAGLSIADLERADGITIPDHVDLLSAHLHLITTE